MKIIAVVPIKLYSERLPNKNIKKFTNGKPLCSYIFETLLDVESINDIYVYCSEKSIIDYIPTDIKFLQRSNELDKNTTTMNEILASFITEIDADIYVLAHATAPFVTADSFEKCINKVKSGDYDSAFSVKKVKKFLWKDYKPINYNLKNIPRTQDLPDIYEETCGFYIFRKDVLQNTNRRIGDKPYLCEVSNIESIDIDDEFDFQIADWVINNYWEK